MSGSISKTFLIVAFLAALAPACWLDAADNFIPPIHTTLGCDGPDLNAVILDCTGSPPYDEMSCTYTRLSVTKQDPAISQKNRAALLAALAKLTQKEADAQAKDACDTLAKPPTTDYSKQGPSVRLLRERGLQFMKGSCDCKGKDLACVKQALAPSLDADERACTVSLSLARHDTFKKVAKDRWISTEASPGVCVAATTQVLENDPKYPGLWTYSLSEVASHSDPLPKLCAGFKGTNEVCSWKHSTAGLLNCEEMHLR
jgi:hypothetical protein